jgi:hypothetical protein
LVALLESLSEEASTAATGRGVGLFVSQALTRRVTLPVTVTPRVVVEPTFATRDLVLALHRPPPHLLLFLHPFGAHLLRGHADTLVPMSSHGFPLTRSAAVLGALERGEEGLEEFLDEVDTALRRARSAHPSPIVLAGTDSLVRAFARRSRNLHRLAATLTGTSVETLTDVYLQARAGLEAYLLSRQDEALNALRAARRERPGDVRSGLAACWDAVREAAPAMLVVEEGFSHPARLVTSGAGEVWGREGGDDESTPHDLVEELIEMVVERGGWVAFARDDALRSDGRVALVLRRGRS